MKISKPQNLHKNHKTDSFDCGNEELNKYLKEFALTNQKTGSARTHVVLDENDNVIAYYTLSATSIQHSEAPDRMAHGMPVSIPAVLIGRFGVDIRYQGKKIGKSLLKDAFYKLANVSENVGFRAVIIDAKNEKSKSYYRSRCGFIPFEDDSLRLYILIKDLKKTL